MAEIEKLTEDERGALSWFGREANRIGLKALRIIGQQAVEIVRLGEDLAQLRERVTKALAALDATRWHPIGLLDEWARTAEGMNHRCVTDARNALRGQETPPVQTQAAPSPDYRSEVERCSCEEALALREELGAASVELKQVADERDRLRVEARREREHSGALVQDIEQLRRAMRAAEVASKASIASLEAEVQRLRAQLPEGMQHCTIRFVECSRGHGRLVATYWVESLCRQCEVERLRAELGRARAKLGVAEHEHRMALGSERIKLAATNALLREWHSLDPDDEDPARSLYARTEAHLSGQAPARTEPEHTAGCRYEHEHPALDPEDCPRCSQRAAPTDPDETDDDRQEMAAGLGFGDYATMVRMLAERGWVRLGAAPREARP